MALLSCITRYSLHFIITYNTTDYLLWTVCLLCCFSSVYMGFPQPSIHYFALTTIVCTGLVCLPACLLYTRYQIEWLAGWLAELTNDDCGWMMDPCMYMAQLNTHSTTQASQSRCVYFFTLYRQSVRQPACHTAIYPSIVQP